VFHFRFNTAISSDPIRPLVGTVFEHHQSGVANRGGAAVDCDERTTVAVGNSCSTHRMFAPAFTGTGSSESGETNVSKCR
jgi:hypothetical protein